MSAEVLDETDEEDRPCYFGLWRFQVDGDEADSGITLDCADCGESIWVEPRLWLIAAEDDADLVCMPCFGWAYEIECTKFFPVGHPEGRCGSCGVDRTEHP